MSIHQTAIIGKRAEIDPTVSIGPYAVIENDVRLDKNVKVRAYAYVCAGTEIGEETEIHMGAVLGHTPQDVAFKDKKTFLKIGKRNIIREHVTVHRGTKESTETVIGDENYLMAHSHIGHNCKVGNKVILANGALLGGYVTIGDSVFVSGNVSVHQFCSIGKFAMIGGYSAVNKDVPPYTMVQGPSRVRSINIIGLKRAGFKKDVISEIQKAFKMVYRSGLNTTQALEKIVDSNPSDEVMEFVEFIKKSKRGICKDTSRRDDEEFYKEGE